MAASPFESKRARRQSISVPLLGDNATRKALDSLQASLAERIDKATGGAVLVVQTANAFLTTDFILSENSRQYRTQIARALNPYNERLEERAVPWPDADDPSFAPQRPTLVVVRSAGAVAPGPVNTLVQTVCAGAGLVASVTYLLWHWRLVC